MKKRIIATILLLVMVLATFASCGSYKFSDEKNFDDYAYVTDYDAFLEALKNIVVEDEDFAIDENERNQTVKEQIYSKLADVFVKDSDKKLTTGTVGANDVVEYYYYCTVTVDGVEYTYDYSKMVTASSMKLPLVDETEDTVSAKIKTALLAATLVTDGNYKVTTTAGTVAEKEKTYVVSYTETWEEFDATDINSGSSDEETKVSYAVITLDETNPLHYHLINGVKKDDNTYDTSTRPSIGSSNKETFTLESTDNLANPDSVKRVTTYTDFTIYGRVDRLANESTFTHTLDEDTKVNVNGVTEEITLAKDTVVTYHVYPVSRVDVPMDVTAEQIVRDILGSSIKTSSVSIFTEDEDTKYTYTVLDYLRYTEDEDDHKKGDIKYDADGKLQYVETMTEDETPVPATKEATLYEIVDALVKEYAKTASKDYTDVDAVKNAQAAYDAAAEAYTAKETAYNTAKTARDNAKTAYDAAQKIVDDAGDAATADQIADRDAKKTAYDEAEAAFKTAETEKSTASTAKTSANTALTKAQNDTKTAKVEVLTRHLLTATRTVDDTTVTSLDDIEAAYTKQTYSALEATHDQNLQTKIGKAVWKVLEENVTVDLDHKDLQNTIKKYKDTLYEQYEYQYYKGTSNNASNYSQYNSVDEYIKAMLKEESGKNVDDVDAALTEKARNTLKDQLIVYAAAKALATDDNVASYKDWVAENKDEWEAIYKHSYEDSDSDLSADEIQEKFDEYYDAVEKEAAALLVTDKVMKDYKKEVGRAQYNLAVDQYGEENIRMTLQFSRLMNFLLYTDYAPDTHAAHDGEYKVAYDGNKIAYRFIEYKLQSEVDAETPEEPVEPAE